MYDVINKMRRDGIEGRQKLLSFFDLSTRDPMQYQTSVLMEIVDQNKDTEYGQKYDFASIKSIEDFQAQVPITEYSDYEGYIDRMANQGETNLIMAQRPVWYNKTSGTVGEPKKIPYSQRTRDWFSRYSLGHQSGLLYRTLGEDFFGGRGLNLIRCAGSITKLPDGTPFGPLSEASLRPYEHLWPHLYPTPPEATFAPPGTDVRYLNSRYSLCDTDLNNIMCTFTGFLLDFCRYVEKHWEMLVKDIETGTIDRTIDLPDELRERLEKDLKPMPERAKALREIFEDGFETPFMPRVWPKLAYIAGGASAGFARYTEEVRKRYLGYDIAFYYRGISSSEGIFTVPVALASQESVLIPDSVFYEFIPIDEAGALPTTLDKLEVGKRYELLITTHSGLYRYRMRDVLLVTGYHNATPMVEFQYRIDKTVNLMGEKTTEMALRLAADKTAEECGFLLVDSAVYPDAEHVQYVYFMEIDRVPKDLSEQEIRDSLERNLQAANPVYAEMTKAGIIRPIRLLFSQPETSVLYKEMMLMRGYSIAQLKPVSVIDKEAQRKFFFALTEDFGELRDQITLV